MSQAPDKKSFEFKFKRPEYPKASKAADLALSIAALTSRLAQEPRTRVKHPDGRAENVAEHSLMLVKVARELAILLYPDLDANLVAVYASLNDDPEAYVGDTATDTITAEKLELKYALDALGEAQLIDEYAPFPSYIKLVKDYGEQKVPEARFVRVVDKIMPILVHFQDNGNVIKQNISKEEQLDPIRRAAKIAELKKDYPEFEEVIILREELVVLMAETFLSSSKTRKINFNTLRAIFRRKSRR